MGQVRIRRKFNTLRAIRYWPAKAVGNVSTIVPTIIYTLTSYCWEILASAAP